MSKLKFALIVLGFISSLNSHAGLVFTETADFSEDLLSPTTLPQQLMLGDNIIKGAVNHLDGDFYDAFLISLAPDLKLSRIMFQAFDITVADQNSRVALGFISILNNVYEAEGLNIFPQSEVPSIAEIGFSSDSAPIGTFNFSHITFAALSGASLFDDVNQIWSLYPAVQGTSSYRWQYTFSVQRVSSVPEPSTIFMTLTAMFFLISRTRRKAVR